MTGLIGASIMLANFIVSCRVSLQNHILGLSYTYLYPLFILSLPCLVLTIISPSVSIAVAKTSGFLSISDRCGSG